MQIPVATYRVQFNSGFRFGDAAALVPYLKGLGISHLYASPVFQARKGSTHGYDVTNPLRLNPELGDASDFEVLSDALREAGLSLLLDIVPNHMAAGPENPWWMDVLENGPASACAGYFDVAWEPSAAGVGERIFLPILGSPYGSTLENQEFKPHIDSSGLFVSYYSWKLPLDPATWAEAIDHPDVPSLSGLMESLSRLPARTATEWDALEARRREVSHARRMLWECYETDREAREAVDRALRRLEGQKGNPRSFDMLDRLLQAQPYVLAFWRTAREKINYRRFFDVTDLVSLRAEIDEVHEITHALLYELIARGTVNGVRVDHIDGLYDPLDYLQRLQARQPGLYVVVEKILSRARMPEGIVREQLPVPWRTCGTSGYDFLGIANNLFVDPAGLDELDRFYRTLTGSDLSFDDVAYSQKKRMIQELFPGEMATLALHLGALAEEDRHARDLSPAGLAAALTEVTACLPVYRTYTRSSEVCERDRGLIVFAIEQARRRGPALDPGLYDFLQRVLLLEFPAYLSEEKHAGWLRFVMRWQQMSGPITAKGVEDTALYRYNRLVSMNEVGGSPYAVPVEEFHAFNAERKQHWDCALNATSTHDTKRSEDVRARINVLSEMASEWTRFVTRWMRWNLPKKREVHGRMTPDGNEELFLYQTLIGAWPLADSEKGEFRERLRMYLRKAAREAKEHTSWLHPDEEYEQALLDFLDAILNPEAPDPFLAEFHRVQRRTAFYGALNSLAQVLLKIAAVGVPDFYQSTVFWDFSLVDPDNRQQVDFPSRIEVFERLKGWEGSDLLPLIRELLDNWQDSAVKAFLAYRALQFRRRHPDLFVRGEYIPLPVEGARSAHVIAFARRREAEWAVAAVPRLVLGFSSREVWPVGGRPWRDTAVRLPQGAPQRWRNELTSQPLAAADGVLPVRALFQHFPVALAGGGTVGIL